MFVKIDEIFYSKWSVIIGVVLYKSIIIFIAVFFKTSSVFSFVLDADLFISIP